MIKLALFDFDDTICLSEEACFNLENKIAEEMGFPPMTREKHQENWGMPLKDAITVRIPGIDADEFVRLEEEYFGKFMSKGKFDKIPEENLDLLRTLKEKGIKVAILTNRTLSEAKHLMHDNHPFSDLLDAFYYKEITPYPKPDPRAFEDALKKFNVKPNETVYAGDSVGDAASATGAGLHSIIVLESGTRTKKDFENYKIDFFAEKFTDSLSYILTH